MDEDAAWHTEVDLGSCRIVLDGVPAPSKGAQQLPSFLLWPQVAHLNYTAELLYRAANAIFGRVGRLNCFWRGGFKSDVDQILYRLLYRSLEAACPLMKTDLNIIHWILS